MGGVQLLENLIHYGVGQVRDHRQLHLPAGKDRNKQFGQCLKPTFFSWCCRFSSSRSYSSALLISSAALSISALRMAERGMETCSEMDERGGLSLSAAEQDMGHNSRHRDTMESTTTWTQGSREKTYYNVSLYTRFSLTIHSQLELFFYIHLSSSVYSICNAAIH